MRPGSTPGGRPHHHPSPGGVDQGDQDQADEDVGDQDRQAPGEAAESGQPRIVSTRPLVK